MLFRFWSHYFEGLPNLVSSPIDYTLLLSNNFSVPSTTPYILQTTASILHNSQMFTSRSPPHKFVFFLCPSSRRRVSQFKKSSSGPGPSRSRKSSCQLTFQFLPKRNIGVNQPNGYVSPFLINLFDIGFQSLSSKGTLVRALTK